MSFILDLHNQDLFPSHSIPFIVVILNRLSHVSSMFWSSKLKAEKLEADKAALITRVAELEAQQQHRGGVEAETTALGAEEETFSMAEEGQDQGEKQVPLSVGSVTSL